MGGVCARPLSQRECNLVGKERIGLAREARKSALEAMMGE